LLCRSSGGFSFARGWGNARLLASGRLACPPIIPAPNALSQIVGYLGDRVGQPVIGNPAHHPVSNCHIANQSAKIWSLWESLHDRSCPRMDGDLNLAIGLIATCGNVTRCRKLATCV
jgi:hypothetical protein